MLVRQLSTKAMSKAWAAGQALAQEQAIGVALDGSAAPTRAVER